MHNLTWGNPDEQHSLDDLRWRKVNEALGSVEVGKDLHAQARGRHSAASLAVVGLAVVLCKAMPAALRAGPGCKRNGASEGFQYHLF